MKEVLKEIKKEILKNIDKEYKINVQKFFKDPIKLHGVRVPTVRKISKKYYKQIKHLPKKELLDLCEELLESKMTEETTIAFAWAQFRYNELTPSDFTRFEKWLKKYVTNWGYCDDFCTHALGHLIWKYPKLVTKTKPWRKSQNRWLRRASAVIFVHQVWSHMKIDKKTFLKNVFETADTLLHDPDDLVQKGYGWMLKVTTDHFPGEVFQYVLKYKNTMPRTALRYAIEKLPKEMKILAMKK